MKRTFSFRNALALALAFCLAIAAIPASALPRFEVKAEVTPAWTVPAGYNVHDYTKCVEFLEQTDENGLKNGEKLSDTYDPNDPETWGVNRDWTHLLMDGPAPDEPCFIWRSVNGEQRIRKINVGGKSLVGPLDISGCIDLVKLNCANCGLTELDLSSNTELGALRCSYNSLAELDLSNNTSLGRLECSYNNLTELDISNSNLSSLKCVGNRLTELDLSNSSFFAIPSFKIKAEGNGYIGVEDYFYSLHSFGVYLYAYPANGVYGPGFEGFYLDNGELISHGWYSEWDEAYIYFYGDGGKGSERWPSGSTIIARFSGWEQTLPYNAHDFAKCVNFLEQMDEYGVKNGDKLSENYDPNDPETWGSCWNGDRFQWTVVYGEQRVRKIYVRKSSIYDADFCGGLDVSGCTALEEMNCSYDNFPELNVTGCTALEKLNCSENNLSELDVTGCTALRELDCSKNNLSELDVTGYTALEKLDCSGNNLTELDVSRNAALSWLYCRDNNLSELDLSQNTALQVLNCSNNNLAELDVSRNIHLNHFSCGKNNLAELDVSMLRRLMSLGCAENNLSELDLTNNTELEELRCSFNNLSALDLSNKTHLFLLFCYGTPIAEIDLSNTTYMPYDAILTEGNGYVGVGCEAWGIFDSGLYGELYAYPVNNAVFEGFFDENGELISRGEWSDEHEAYICHFGYDATGTVIARFSGGVTPGDIDGNGSVTVADAITALRLAMGLLDGSGMNTDAADMDGNGSITIADAIVILRTAMGLA